MMSKSNYICNVDFDVRLNMNFTIGSSLSYRKGEWYHVDKVEGDDSGRDQWYQVTDRNEKSGWEEVSYFITRGQHRKQQLNKLLV
jgi:hypothetical protein